MEFPRRHVPRLSFTDRPGPRIETGDGVHDVIDLSVEGLRFRTEGAEAAGTTIGDILHATLRFPADRRVEIEGRVLRADGRETAIQLVRGHERLAPVLPMGPARPRRHGLLW
jgi:hypothetical protein